MDESIKYVIITNLNPQYNRKDFEEIFEDYLKSDMGWINFSEQDKHRPNLLVVGFNISSKVDNPRLSVEMFLASLKMELFYFLCGDNTRSLSWELQEILFREGIDIKGFLSEVSIKPRINYTCTHSRMDNYFQAVRDQRRKLYENMGMEHVLKNDEPIELSFDEEEFSPQIIKEFLINLNDIYMAISGDILSVTFETMEKNISRTECIKNSFQQKF